MTRRRDHSLVALLLLAISQSYVPSLADAISPNINPDWDTYSHEKADSSFFGPGPAGKLSEGSYLRFVGEQELSDRNFDKAIKTLSKAVEMDGGDPTGHVLYARALSGKLSSTPEIDENLLEQTLKEWTLIWRHDADQVEQGEAKHQVWKLYRLKKSIAKHKKDERDKAGSLVAEKGHRSL